MQNALRPSLFFLFFSLSHFSQAQEIDTTMWVTNGTVRAIARSGNTIYLGGSFTNVGPNTGSGIIINKSDGKRTSKSTLRVDGSIKISIPDGRGGWYIGGSFSQVQGIYRSSLAHILPSGVLDLTWNPIVTHTNDVNISAIAISNDIVYVGGEFSSIDGQSRNYLAALDAATGQVTPWNPNPDRRVNSLAISGNTLYVGGAFSSIEGLPRIRIASYNATTGQVNSWNPNVNAGEKVDSSNVYAIAVSGSNVYIGGDFRSMGGKNRYYLASLDIATGQVTSWDPSADFTVFTLAVSNGIVYAGGSFSKVGGQTRKGLAALDAVTGQVTFWNSNTDVWQDITIYTIVVADDNIFVGGAFNSIGGQTRKGLAALDAVTGQITSWNPNPNGTVLTLTAADSTLFVGGGFNSVDGQTRKGLAALDAVTGQATSWNPNLKPNDFVTISTIAVSNNIVYVGGRTSSDGIQIKSYLAAVDAITGQPTPWNPNPNRYDVKSIAVSNDVVYVGGDFTSVGGQSRSCLAALDAVTGQATSWDPNADNTVLTIAISGQTLYVGGGFRNIGGQSRRGLAALDGVTGQATSWNPVAGGWVYTLLVFGNTIYAGGSFDSMGNQPRSNLAAVDANTGQVTPWNPKSNKLVFSLAMSDNTIYAGGLFTEMGDQPRSYFAALDAISGQLNPWNPTRMWDSSRDRLFNAVLHVTSIHNTIYIGGYFKTGGYAHFASFARKFFKTNLIRGSIFKDDDVDCIKNLNEKGLPNIFVVAQPGNYFGSTDSLGNYSIRVDTGSYLLEQITPVDKIAFIRPVCSPDPNTQPIRFTGSDDTIAVKDFGNQIILQPSLSVQISSIRRRRCFSNISTISYWNSGTAEADSIKVYVKLPEFVVLVEAGLPYQIDKDGNFVFTIGKLAAGVYGSIMIKDSVVCGNPAILGLTQCTKVWITPSNQKTPSSTWDHSEVELKAQCLDNGFVRLAIYNTGTGSMADSSAFRILLNAHLAFLGNYLLSRGDSLVLRVPANGRTVRLEADQRLGHPSKQQSSLTIEACGTNQNGSVSTGFVTQLPPDDEAPEVDIECLPIIDSYDPNDKLVSPRGVTAEKYTPTQAKLDYVIRFQNTGTDVAYQVVVIDTLSEQLDMSTLQVRGASHPYQYHISGKGKPVITWTFDDIQLPDSTTDQLGSNGFVHFTIRPKKDLPEKTQIENFADIFFDFNEAVRTNTTLNTIYDVPPIVVNAVRLEAKVVYNLPTITGLEPSVAPVWNIYPSPHSGQFTVELPAHMGKITQLMILDAMGQNVYTHPLTQAQSQEINLSGCAGGIYFVKVQTDKGVFVKRTIKQ